MEGNEKGVVAADKKGERIENVEKENVKPGAEDEGKGNKETKKPTRSFVRLLPIQLCAARIESLIKAR
jgi:hypothetical protein